MGQVSAFIKYLTDKSSAIPNVVYEKAKDCLCDYLAVTMAGAETNKSRWSEYLSHADVGKVQIWGYDAKTDGKTAALVNGFNAHSLELDDGQRFTMIHLGASIISALLSAESESKMGYVNLLRGIVMGYEAACRLSISMQPSHKQCGFHAAGTCGTVGSAIAVAFALNMGFTQLETVLTVALASATGLLEIQEQASEMKPYNVGRAAMDGLAAAYMGFTDFTAPDDILNGERGFLKLFSRQYELNKLTNDADYYEIERIYVKPYAACRHCHSAIEAALKLRENLEISDIREIEVITYHLALKGHNHTEIVGPSSAKLSIPYSVAVSLITGKADASVFEKPYVNREDILSLTNKVTVKENDCFTEESPNKRIARVCIYKHDGTYLSKQIDYAKGEPENPMSRQEIMRKTVTLVGNKANMIFEYAYKDL